VVNKDTKAEMQTILEEIQTGEFAREWIVENQAGQPKFKALREKNINHPITKIGKEIRAMMGWLNNESK
jgi:ketol-acid reductoisomerase